MSIEDELRREAQKDSGGRTLGEAANRYVTFQIWVAVAVLGVMALVVLLVVLLCGGFLGFASMAGPGN